MDKLKQYRDVLKQVITNEANHTPGVGAIEIIPIIDEVHDQYQVLLIGWNRLGRVFSVILHLRLHDEKVWIEYDGTSEGVANTLLEAGLPHDDIVLAFHPPHKRPLTDFAVA
jgi:hypothetical protein